jgi:hypothetical protein
MPCVECGSPLFVSEKYEDLRCPNCSNLSVASPELVESQVKTHRDYFGEKELIEFLKDYDKEQLILALLRMGNKAASQIWEDRGISLRDFALPPRLIKLLLPESGFGGKRLDVNDWPPDVLETVLDFHFNVLRTLSHLEDQFVYAYPKVTLEDTSSILSSHAIYSSEYQYCFDRCTRSLLGGREKHRDRFDSVDLEFRDFDTPEADEIETAKDFGRTFYEFIIGISFFMSSNDSLGETYHNDFPESVTILDIGDFLEELDLGYVDGALGQMRFEGELAMTQWSEINRAGEDVFGEDWPTVRENIVVTAENTNAHPFLFGLPVSQRPEAAPLGSTVTIDLPMVFYASEYARFIRFQMFPMLSDEEGTPGKDIINEITSDRGIPYERNIYGYLDEQGFEAYHNLKHYGDNDHQLDLLVVAHERGELWLIECKYKVPYMRMDTANGIEDFNDKMYRSVFEDGEAFDEKADWWLTNKPGDNFTWQEGDDGDRTVTTFEEAWTDLQVRRLVVSNLVPSYPVKRGIRFLTGMEFMGFTESGKLPYAPKRESLVEGTLPAE